MSDKTIKINFKHIVIIISVLFSLVLLGSLLDLVRIQQKYKSMEHHGTDILNAHKDSFIKILNDDKTINSKFTLNNINRPENGTYNVYVIKKEGSELRFYPSDHYPINTDANLHSFLLSSKQNSDTKPNLKNKLHSARIKSLDSLFWEKNNLYSFIPVFENENLLGYVVIRVGKSKNI